VIGVIINWISHREPRLQHRPAPDTCRSRGHADRHSRTGHHRAPLASRLRVCRLRLRVPARRPSPPGPRPARRPFVSSLRRSPVPPPVGLSPAPPPLASLLAARWPGPASVAHTAGALAIACHTRRDHLCRVPTSRPCSRSQRPAFRVVGFWGLRAGCPSRARRVVVECPPRATMAGPSRPARCTQPRLTGRDPDPLTACVTPSQLRYRPRSRPQTQQG
jgi:hypothetical protein